MFAVDTNLLIYAHFERYPQHAKARAFIDDMLVGPASWCMGWQVVYEYVRITTHPSVHELPLTAEQALDDLAPYFSASNGQVLTQTPQHRAVLEATLRSVPTVRGNLIHDLHYATLLREHGVSEIYTADSDFEKFDFLTVHDPTR